MGKVKDTERREAQENSRGRFGIHTGDSHDSVSMAGKQHDNTDDFGRDGSSRNNIQFRHVVILGTAAKGLCGSIYSALFYGEHYMTWTMILCDYHTNFEDRSRERSQCLAI